MNPRAVQVLCAALVIAGGIGALAYFRGRPAPPTPAVEPAREKPRQKFVRTDVAEEGGVTESQLKAAALLALSRNVTWPASSFANPESPFLIGVLGLSPVADDFLKPDRPARKVGDRTVQLRRGSEPGQLDKCHVIFVPEGWKDDWGLLLKELCTPGVLVVGEEDGFLEAGGILLLGIQDRKLALGVNRRNADRAGLTISPKVTFARETGK